MFRKLLIAAGVLLFLAAFAANAAEKSSGMTTLKEDCVSINLASSEVKQVGGNWKIVEGQNALMDFGQSKDQAEKTLSILKHYNANRVCYVGRPNPPVTYILTAKGAPMGKMTGEDCMMFTIKNLKISQMGGMWHIMDGKTSLFAFRDEAQAKQAHEIIKKHKFTESCFVGRPNPTFSYLRK